MVTAATSPLIDDMAEIGKIIVWHVLVQFLYPKTNKLFLKARGEKFASGFKIIRVSTFNFIKRKSPVMLHYNRFQMVYLCFRSPLVQLRDGVHFSII